MLAVELKSTGTAKDTSNKEEMVLLGPTPNIVKSEGQQISKKDLLQLSKTSLQAQLANCKMNEFHSAVSRQVKKASQEKKVHIYMYARALNFTPNFKAGSHFCDSFVFLFTCAYTSQVKSRLQYQGCTVKSPNSIALHVYYYDVTSKQFIVY